MSLSSIHYLTGIFVFAILIISTQSRGIQFAIPDLEIPNETPEEKFDRSDVNEDDKLTFDEFLRTELAYERIKKEEFDSLDLNKDGFISNKEYDQYLADQYEKKIQRRAEYFGKIYEDFDDNFDMKLSEPEVKRMLAERFLLKPRSNFTKIFNSFDENRNGGLEIEEYLKFDDKLPFELMDATGDEKSDEVMRRAQKEEASPANERQRKANSV